MDKAVLNIHVYGYEKRGVVVDARQNQRTVCPILDGDPFFYVQQGLLFFFFCS